MASPKGLANAGIRYLPVAATEYREQIVYYKAKAPGLGRQFGDAIKNAERLVLATPEGFAHVDDSTEIRAAVVRRFPFRLLYALRGGGILVVAVAHTARAPGQFLGRL